MPAPRRALAGPRGAGRHRGAQRAHGGQILRRVCQKHPRRLLGHVHRQVPCVGLRPHPLPCHVGMAGAFPLLLWMLYPAACLNEWLMPIAGINCAQLITAAMLTVADFASFVLFHRLLRDVVGLCRADTALLTALFFSFAYVMVPMVVPDHFAFSLCLLLLTLYVCGRHAAVGPGRRAAHGGHGWRNAEQRGESGARPVDGQRPAVFRLAQLAGGCGPALGAAAVGRLQRGGRAPAQDRRRPAAGKRHPAQEQYAHPRRPRRRSKKFLKALRL